MIVRSYRTIVSALWPYFFNLDRRPREGIPSAVYGGVNGGATGLRTSVAASDPAEVLCAKYEAACLGRAGLLPDYSRTAAVAERGVERLFFMMSSKRIPGPRHETSIIARLVRPLTIDHTIKTIKPDH